MNDQEFENLLRKIATDAALKDGSADQIADSPALLWCIQREIRNAEPAKAPWPPNFLRRFLVIGVPIAAALLLVLGLYLRTSRMNAPEVASVPEPATPQAIVTKPTIEREPQISSTTYSNSANETSASAEPRRQIIKASLASRHDTGRKVPATQVAAIKSSSASEIKSEFIALAYARSPESGQLVRVKVPSSMMVSLGVVPTVNDPSKLIDAEVLLGDDGLTHAIRFIRQ